MKSSRTIPVAIVVGGFIIAAAIYVSVPKSTSVGAGNPAPLRVVDSSDHILGNPAAKVMIIEYSDFDCEYCKAFHDTLHTVVANEGAKGDVAWTYREFPLTEIHPTALSHAKAAECVAAVSGNDAFWKFADLLFLNQPADPARYGEFARSSGVQDDTAFATCFAGTQTAISARIAEDREYAISAGAIGTPYTLITATGKPTVVIAGNYSYDAVKQLVDQALAR